MLIYTLYICIHTQIHRYTVTGIYANVLLSDSVLLVYFHNQLLLQLCVEQRCSEKINAFASQRAVNGLHRRLQQISLILFAPLISRLNTQRQYNEGGKTPSNERFWKGENIQRRQCQLIEDLNSSSGTVIHRLLRFRKTN